MAIQDNYVPAKALGNGVTTDFSFGFSILAEANIRVYLEDIVTGVQTLQVLGSDYTVLDFDEDGGNIRYTTAPVSDYYSIIARNIPKNQNVPYTTSSGFQGKVVENSFDKVTATVQDISEKVDRGIQYPLGTIGAPSILPVPGTDLAYLYFDGSIYDWVEAITATGDYPGNITRGIDASKSASPAVGDIYVATDTQILYICFTIATWTDYNQDIKDANSKLIYGIDQDNFAGGTIGVAGGKWLEQSFTSVSEMYVDRITLRFQSLAVANIKIRIETDNNGVPSGVLASGFSEVSVSGTGTPERVYPLGYTGRLDANTKYWLRINPDGVGTNSYFYANSNVMVGEQWRYDGGAFNINDIFLKIGTLGLAVGEAIKITTDGYEKAQADSEANSKTFAGIIESVVDTSFYEITRLVLSGAIIGQTSLVEGALYFLDPATPGALTTTKPTTATQVVKPVLIAITEIEGIVINQLGVLIEAIDYAVVYGPGTELTITVAGEITITGSYHTVDTQADAATDNLDTIIGGIEGQELILVAEDDTRTVVVRNGIDNIVCGADRSLNSLSDTIVLQKRGTDWIMKSYADNA